MKRAILTKQRTFRITEEMEDKLRQLATTAKQHEAALIRNFVDQAVSYYIRNPEALVSTHYQ